MNSLLALRNVCYIDCVCLLLLRSPKTLPSYLKNSEWKTLKKQTPKRLNTSQQKITMVSVYLLCHNISKGLVFSSFAHFHAPQVVLLIKLQWENFFLPLVVTFALHHSRCMMWRKVDKTSVLCHYGPNLWFEGTVQLYKLCKAYSFIQHNFCSTKASRINHIWLTLVLVR